MSFQTGNVEKVETRLAVIYPVLLFQLSYWH